MLSFPYCYAIHISITRYTQNHATASLIYLFYHIWTFLPTYVMLVVMEGLDDRVYKFIIAGRIIFLSAVLITLILLTATAVSSQKMSSNDISLKDPDVSLSPHTPSDDNHNTDDVNTPVTGNDTDDSDAPDLIDVSDNSIEENDPLVEETPVTTVPDYQNAEYHYYRANTQSNTTITPNQTATSQPTPTARPVSQPTTPAFDYNEVRYVDDNGENIDNGDGSLTPIIVVYPTEPEENPENP